MRVTIPLLVKLLAIAMVCWGILLAGSALANYTPPNNGGPDSSQGSGTR
ncbi:MAG: hypothetical protein VKK04_22470 [Synechococcales bacterium]|nr:hypothetical protein [Synechococcales bacterium]